MNTPLRNRFETQIKSLRGFDFQEVVVKIFQMKFGEINFTDMRPQKDKGCDGIIEIEQRIIACYGPEETQNTKKRLKDFELKANSDFSEYKKNWQTQYPNWSIVINHRNDPNYDKIVKKLQNTSSVIGITQLLSIIESLKNHQRRKLGIFLNIEPEFLSSDYIGEILEDLLKEEENFEIDVEYNPKSLIEISDKIELNFGSDEINDAKEEYEDFLLEGLYSEVNTILYGYEDGEIKKIKRRAINDFTNKTNGTFKQRLMILTNHYLDKYASEKDDDYHYYIRGVLLYLFEQCLIGNKTTQEI